MINGELRKADDVHDRRTILFQIRKQLFRGPGLMRSAERENHSPMAALEVTLPRPAAFFFQ